MIIAIIILILSITSIMFIIFLHTQGIFTILYDISTSFLVSGLTYFITIGIFDIKKYIRYKKIKNNICKEKQKFINKLSKALKIAGCIEKEKYKFIIKSQNNIENFKRTEISSSTRKDVIDITYNSLVSNYNSLIKYIESFSRSPQSNNEKLDMYIINSIDALHKGIDILWLFCSDSHINAGNQYKLITLEDNCNIEIDFRDIIK